MTILIQLLAGNKGFNYIACSQKPRKSVMCVQIDANHCLVHVGL